MNSTEKTLRHVRRVATLLSEFASELLRRASVHDESKFLPIEAEPLAKLDALIDKEGNVPFGSEEYERRKSLLGPMLENHYRSNSHQTMTTIAYRNRVLAFDTRAMFRHSGVIASDSMDKGGYLPDGAVYAGCGSAARAAEFVSSLIAGKPDTSLLSYDTNVVIMWKDRLEYWGDDGRLPLKIDHVYAWGSGGQGAAVALILGKSAKQAIEIAMRVDAHTGGRVVTMKPRAKYKKR